MHKALLVTLFALIACSAQAGGFGQGVAGGILGGLIVNGIQQAQRPAPPPQQVVVVVHDHQQQPVHHTHKADPDKPKKEVVHAEPVTARKIDNPTDLSADQMLMTSSKDSAVAFLEDYFKRVNPRFTLGDTSLFVEVEIGAYHYLVAKMSINTPVGQMDEGCVIDLKNSITANLPMPSYHEFMQTGNVNILGEHPLNPLE